MVEKGIHDGILLLLTTITTTIFPLPPPSYSPFMEMVIARARQYSQSLPFMIIIQTNGTYTIFRAIHCFIEFGRREGIDGGAGGTTTGLGFTESIRRREEEGEG